MKEKRIIKLVNIYQRINLFPGHWIWRRMATANKMNSKLANRTEIMCMGRPFIKGVK
jgi:hypothetical protein